MGMPEDTDKEEVDLDEFAEFENQQEYIQALGKTPLVQNPFFVRTMADAAFIGDGTEGIEPGKEIIAAYRKLLCLL